MHKTHESLSPISTDVCVQQKKRLQRASPINSSPDLLPREIELGENVHPSPALARIRCMFHS